MSPRRLYAAMKFQVVSQYLGVLPFLNCLTDTRWICNKMNTENESKKQILKLVKNATIALQLCKPIPSPAPTDYNYLKK